MTRPTMRRLSATLLVSLACAAALASLPARAHAHHKPSHDPKPSPSGHQPADQGSKAHQPAPSASPEPGPPASPGPRPASPAPGEGAPDPRPTPGDRPTAPPETGEIAVAARSGVLLGQVGDGVTYSIHVEVTEPHERLVVTASVPEEVDISSIPLHDRAEAISSARRGAREDIVWVLRDVLPEEEIDLYWSGVVATAGDLEATTEVEARAGGRSATAEARTFLAGTAGLRTEGVAPADTQVLGKVVRLIPTARSAPAGSALLPVTGWSPAPMLWLGLGFVACGTLLLVTASDRRRRRALALMAVLAITAACTPVTESPPEIGAPPAETPADEDSSDEPDDQVKGKVIYRDDATPPSRGPETEVATQQEPQPTQQEPQEPAPAGSEGTGITYRRVVEVVPIDVDPAVQEPRASDNTVYVSWNEAARAVDVATSGTRFTADQRSTLMTSLTSDSDGLGSVVELTNTSEAPLHVRGRLVLQISQGDEVVGTLGSRPIDVVLAPRGSVEVSYRYLLPTGEYLLTSNFQF